MTIICDPTLLQTRRGLEWIDRAVAHNGAHLLCTSRAFIEGRDETKWSPGGLFSSRPRPHWTVDTAPIALVDHRASGKDEVTDHLTERRQHAVADIWSALRRGHLLAARRPRVLDELVASGVTLSVTSAKPLDASSVWPSMPDDLDGALSRRVRFLCRILASPEAGEQLRVVDMGWGTRR